MARRKREGAALIFILIAVGFLGLLIGCRFRIPALVLVNTIIVCTISVAGIVEGWSIAKTVLLLFTFLTVASVAYLLGLSLFKIFSSLSARRNQNS